MNPNFIYLLLCDNDYGQFLERAADLLMISLGKEPVLVSEARIKSVTINLVLALNDLHAAGTGFELPSAQSRVYLERKLRVEFSNKSKTLPDHDGGSVAIDRTRQYIWRF